MEPKLASEKEAVALAKEKKVTIFINWEKVGEEEKCFLDTFRGRRCMGIAEFDGGFTRLVQDPYAEVTRVGR